MGCECRLPLPKATALCRLSCHLFNNKMLEPGWKLPTSRCSILSSQWLLKLSYCTLQLQCFLDVLEHLILVSCRGKWACLLIMWGKREDLRWWEEATGRWIRRRWKWRPWLVGCWQCEKHRQSGPSTWVLCHIRAPSRRHRLFPCLVWSA